MSDSQVHFKVVEAEFHNSGCCEYLCVICPTFSQQLQYNLVILFCVKRLRHHIAFCELNVFVVDFKPFSKFSRVFSIENSDESGVAVCLSYNRSSYCRNRNSFSNICHDQCTHSMEVSCHWLRCKKSLCILCNFIVKCIPYWNK